MTNLTFSLLASGMLAFGALGCAKDHATPPAQHATAASNPGQHNPALFGAPIDTTESAADSETTPNTKPALATTAATGAKH